MVCLRNLAIASVAVSGAAAVAIPSDSDVTRHAIKSRQSDAKQWELVLEVGANKVSDDNATRKRAGTIGRY